MFTRRSFLGRSAGVMSLGTLAPGLWRRAAAAAEPRKDATILVVLELTGGNDGLNTVVPHADEVYHKSRPTLRVEPAKVLKLDDRVGLHPALKDLHKVWEAGGLAIVQGVGYPNPNRSHSRSMEIWQTGSVGQVPRLAGWGGSGTLTPSSTLPRGSGDHAPGRDGRKTVAQSLSSIADFRLLPAPRCRRAGNEGLDPLIDQVRLRSRRPATCPRGWIGFQRHAAAAPETLEGRLDIVRRLIEPDTPFRIFYTSQEGFDTHASQLYTHQELLRTLARAVGEFLARLRSSKLDERVLVLVFSEFGRRLKENANHGTDHGTAGPVFVAGSAVKGGLVGPQPNLSDLDESGDPRFGVDFRDVYATLLRHWLDVDPCRSWARENGLALV